jgi:hypothetical protein
MVFARLQSALVVHGAALDQSERSCDETMGCCNLIVYHHIPTKCKGKLLRATGEPNYPKYIIKKWCTV